MRPSGRANNEMREVKFTRGYTCYAEGSVLVECGATKVLCTASVENRIPPWRRGSGEGWLTAEYGLLPRATHTRNGREAVRGKQSGRTLEIQRLIGRSLRAVMDLGAIGERTITCRRLIVLLNSPCCRTSFMTSLNCVRSTKFSLDVSSFSS